MRIQGPRTFLARPFWRDYVLSYVLIGFGFTLTSPSFPMLLRAVGALLGIGGVVVLICALGYSFFQIIFYFEARAKRARGFEVIQQGEASDQSTHSSSAEDSAATEDED